MPRSHCGWQRRVEVGPDGCALLLPVCKGAMASLAQDQNVSLVAGILRIHARDEDVMDVQGLCRKSSSTTFAAIPACSLHALLEPAITCPLPIRLYLDHLGRYACRLRGLWHRGRRLGYGRDRHEVELDLASSPSRFRIVAIMPSVGIYR